MITIFGYKFVEKWTELSPRYAEYDEIPELNLSPFPRYMERQANGIGPEDAPKDMNPLEVQSLMVSGPVLEGYCNDLIGRLNGLIQERKVELSRARAMAMSTMQDAKSEAARERMLSMDTGVQSKNWEIADLENMRDYLKGVFKCLSDATWGWRSVYYGTQMEKKQTPPIEAPNIGGPE